MGRSSPLAPDRSPGSLATDHALLVDGFLIAWAPSPLPTSNNVHQTLVLSHKLLQAPAIHLLGLSEQIGNFSVACNRIGQGVSPFCGSSTLLAQRRISRNAIPFVKTAGSLYRLPAVLHLMG